MYIAGVGLSTETDQSSDNSSNSNTTYSCMSTTQKKVWQLQNLAGINNDQCKLLSLTRNFSIFILFLQNVTSSQEPQNL